MRANFGTQWVSGLRLGRELRRKVRSRSSQARGEVVSSKNFSNYSEELLLEGDLGTKALSHLGNATWWEYSQGSSLLFWRWPKGFQREAAKRGFSPWFVDAPPTSYKRAKKPNSKDFVLYLKKFSDIIVRHLR